MPADHSLPPDGRIPPDHGLPPDARIPPDHGLPPDGRIPPDHSILAVRRSLAPFRGSQSTLSRQQLRTLAVQHLSHDLYAGADVDVDGFDALRLVLPDAVASHHTAARELGLPVDGDGCLHVTRDPAFGVSRRAGVQVHRSVLTPEDIAWHRERPFTSGPRTFLDLADGRSLEQLIILGDAVLRRTGMTPAILAARAAAFHAPGVVRARQAIPLMAERVDSPQESRMRLIAHAAGFTGLQPGLVVRDEDGGWLFAGDLVDPKWKVIGQYDGGSHFWAGDRQRTLRQRRLDVARDELGRQAGHQVVIVLAGDMGPAPYWQLDAHWRMLDKFRAAYDRARQLRRAG